MSNYCNQGNIDNLGRIVFGEARGEQPRGQLGVAYSVVNRVQHPGYPNSMNDVMYQKYSNGSQHHYNTLDDKHHDSEWEKARRNNTAEYQNAVKASRSALCREQPDPTGGAVNFASNDPNPATSDNPYYRAVNKQKIGNHWFTGRQAR